jgi:hypothetical protein
MWLPEILLYNGIAWKSFVWWVCLKLCKPIVQKNLRPEFLYLSHLLLGVDEVSHSVSSHGSLSQLFAMNMIHDQTLCEWGLP